MKLTRTLIFLCLLSGSAVAQPHLENEFLKVTVNENGSIRFLDKKNQVSWGSEHAGWVEAFIRDNIEKIPLDTCDIYFERTGESIIVSYKTDQDQKRKSPEFEMRVKLDLIGKHFDMEILDFTSSLPLNRIEYPAHILSVESGIEDGYIVAPNLQGVIYPSRYDAGFMRYGHNVWKNIADVERLWSLETGDLNMPWVGASKNNSSAMIYIKTSSDCQIRVIGNKLVKEDGLAVVNGRGNIPGARISSHSPVWLASKHQLSFPRKMRIELVENGYVGMAKRYKEYARESGRFVTMAEKIRRNPMYQKIIGAPDIKIYCYTNRLNTPSLRAWCEPVLNGYEKVNTTFDQVAEMSNDLKKTGIEKCMILLGGWIHEGYDRQHIDVWPPAEKAGGIDGLKKAAETVIKNGYLFSIHDNYVNYYPDAPSFDERFILKEQDGSMSHGGVWDGGTCYVICPTQREQLLEKNLNLILQNIPLNAFYFDQETSIPLVECYDDRHPISRKEDLKYRTDLLKNIINRGLLIGGERGTDWAMPIVGFFEGLSGGPTGYHRGVTYETGITIPLFYLVYHECIVGYWQHGTPSGREDHANHILLDLLCAQPSSWSVEYAQWEDLKPLIKEAYDLLNPLHENTAHSAMVNHRILSDDFMVQQSEFGNGTKVWVNYGVITYTKDALEIPPKGFRVEITDKSPITGRMQRNVAVDN